MTQRLQDRYELLGELGRGGMGVIYAARDRQSGAELVIKTIQGALDERSRQRFEREALALAQLSHPNILRIHAYGFEGLTPYMILPRVRGRDWAQVLEDALHHEGLPSPVEVCKIMAQIADALAYLHERGLAHRDIKPANILIDEDTGRPLLIDFGLVLMSHSEDLTKTGEILGSVAYMPPEAFDASPKRNAAAMDLWALGVTLYESLSGKLPFDGHGAELLARIASAAPNSLSQVDTRVPRPLSKLVLSLLNKSPDARPAAATCARALRSPNTELKPRGRFAFAAAGLAVLAILVILALAAPLGLSLVPQPPPFLQLEPLPEATNQSRFVLRGRATPGSSLTLRCNNSELSVPLRGEGFELNVPLVEGPNELDFSARAGLFGPRRELSVTIVRDTEPPQLIIEDPPATFESRLQLEGEFNESGCTLEMPELDPQTRDRRLSFHVPVREGRHELVLRFRDAAGNEATTVLSLTGLPTLRVGAGERWTRVQDALSQAPFRARVIIDSGEYSEALIISGDRQIEMMPAPGAKVRLLAFGLPVLRIQSGQVTLRNLDFLCHSDFMPGIELFQGDLLIENCSIECANSALSVKVTGEKSRASIQSSHLSGTGIACLRVENGGFAEIQRSKLSLKREDSNGHLVEVLRSGRALVKSCDLKGGASNISLTAETEHPSFATLESCILSAARTSGIRVRGSAAKIQARDLRVSDTPIAISISDNSSFEGEDIVIFKARRMGVEVSSASSLSLIGGRIEDCPTHALAISHRSRAIFSKLVILRSGLGDPGGPVIRVEDNTKVSISDSSLWDSRTPIIAMSGGSELTFKNCEFEKLSAEDRVPGLTFIDCR